MIVTLAVLSSLFYGFSVLVDDVSLDARALLWGMVAGIGGITGVVVFYAALSRGAMTVAAPVTGVVSAVIPVAIGLLLGERPGAPAVIGAVLAVLAVSLIGGLVGVPHGRVTAAALALPVIAGSAFGLWFVALERSGDDSGWWPLLTARFITIPMLVIVHVTSGRRQPVVYERSAVRDAVSAGLLIMLANVTYLVAVREGLLSVVAAIVSLYPAATVALAMLIDRERVVRIQVAGMGIALVSLLLVSTGA
ncbi:MAG: DMT family transporter [Actinobacteria bacterium]|nr:DMT family transporter [Actinomycetota bacterium]